MTLYFDEEEVGNLLSSIEEELVKREQGAAVRLEISKGFDPQLMTQFLDALDLSKNSVYETDGPINQV